MDTMTDALQTNCKRNKYFQDKLKRKLIIVCSNFISKVVFKLRIKNNSTIVLHIKAARKCKPQGNNN